MHRTNSVADALNTGNAKIDTGSGVVATVPLSGTPTIPDTGLYDISALTAGHTGGVVQIRRHGDVVRLNFYGATFTSTNVNLYTLPVGFRPDYHTIAMQHLHAGQTAHSRVIVSSANGSVTPIGGTDATAVYASLMWLTRDAFPKSVPGIKV